VRLMMNLVMMGTDALPRGGVINVRIRNEAAGMTMVLSCKGERAKLKDDTAAALTGGEPADGWRPENIQPYFARMLCEGLGGELSANQGDGQVIFMATGVRAEG
ncbi:MAG: hypothetical protein KDA53_17370, partial [Hyphomonas sp.]|nr:hypothetical protein [Hyphomonas sp.]